MNLHNNTSKISKNLYKYSQKELLQLNTLFYASDQALSLLEKPSNRLLCSTKNFSPWLGCVNRGLGICLICLEIFAPRYNTSILTLLKRKLQMHAENELQTHWGDSMYHTITLTTSGFLGSSKIRSGAHRSTLMILDGWDRSNTGKSSVHIMVSIGAISTNAVLLKIWWASEICNFYTFCL